MTQSSPQGSTPNSSKQDSEMHELKASEYPPYACDSCGVTNGDMFWDYIEHNDNTLTYAEVKDLCDEFDSYRAKWHRHNEEVSHAVRSAKKRPRAVRRQTNDQL